MFWFAFWTLECGIITCSKLLFKVLFSCNSPFKVFSGILSVYLRPYRTIRSDCPANTPLNHIIYSPYSVSLTTSPTISSFIGTSNGLEFLITENLRVAKLLYCSLNLLPSRIESIIIKTKIKASIINYIQTISIPLWPISARWLL